MWTRKEIKANAKEALRRFYWSGVLVFIAYTIFNEILGLCISVITKLTQIEYLYTLIQMLCLMFIIMPLQVGLCCFFARSRTDSPRYGNILYTFKNKRYLRIVGAMAWQLLFLALWYFVPYFIIKAAMYPFYQANYSVTVSFILSFIQTLISLVIVLTKFLSYSMVPFILTDNPAMGFRRALKLSMAMTKGYRQRIVLLYLSFVGWILLALAPLWIGIAVFSFRVILPFIMLFRLGLIFILPYLYTSTAELYIKLRDHAVSGNICTGEELNLPDTENQM